MSRTIKAWERKRIEEQLFAKHFNILSARIRDLELKIKMLEAKIEKISYSFEPISEGSKKALPRGKK